MDFGKLSDIQNVNFHLPVENEATTHFLSKLLPSQNPQIQLGCPAWTCKEWIGKIYPFGTNPQNFLREYSRHFDTVEFNSTHYHIPNASQIQQWKNKALSPFTFCPKIPQSISHFRRLKNVQSLVNEFTESIAQFDEKLGACFIQLPPDFSPKESENLIEFIDLFPQKIPLAIEFRHEDWFKGGILPEKVFSEMEKHKVATVITDVAGRRDVLHQRLTANFVLIRFVGNALHPTDYQRIDEWAVQIENWLGRGIEKIFFFLHQPQEALCPEIAFYAAQKFRFNKLQFKSPIFIPKKMQKSLF
ncbi:MAG: DUF72 domain-containing protein [Flammeovirgaceae bacterium]